MRAPQEIVDTIIDNFAMSEEEWTIWVLPPEARTLMACSDLSFLSTKEPNASFCRDQLLRAEDGSLPQ